MTHDAILNNGGLGHLRVALVVDCLTVYGGAERVIEQVLQLFPQADLFALVDFAGDSGASFLGGRNVKTSFIQRLPFARKRFRGYLQLWPMAMEQFDLSAYDLVISSHYAVAHGVITHPSQTHLVYTHSPMRYAWDLQHQYLKNSNLARSGLKSFYVRHVLHRLRIWDYSAAQRVDGFATNSRFVSSRVKKFYGRKSQVVYPPVETQRFAMSNEKEDYYVTVGRLVPYKRVDLIVEAFNRMPDKRLIVIGSGPELEKIGRIARDNIRLLGQVGAAQLREIVAKAKAFVFGALEDFGIAPVEAQAAGVPVIGYGNGGLLETVRGLAESRPTGLFFFDQSADAIVSAVSTFEQEAQWFRPIDCRENALRFDVKHFRSNFATFVEANLGQGSTNVIQQSFARPGPQLSVAPKEVAAL